METDFPRRAVHLDFHTMPRVHDVGLEFDAQSWAQTLREARVDYITVFGRCNLGFAYYPTSVGLPHPGLQTPDMLGPMIEACHAREIRVAVYVNAGIDHEHARRHREWCKVNREGQVYKLLQMGHFFRTMCLNTGYRAHILSMVEEILTAYPVDGLFLDCFDLSPCYGVECLDGMRDADLDPFDEVQAREYCFSMTDGFLDDVEDRVERLAPGINLYYNGIRYRRQPTHVELEVLPTGGWGYDYLPFVIRYARTLGKPYFTMTGRFHKSWGDFGGLRTAPSLLFDCYYSIANGGTCSIGDHMHPRGRLDPEVYRLVDSTYASVEALEPWTDGARAAAEIVVVDPVLERVPGGARIGQGHSLQGAARMLSELKCQFDLSDGDVDLSRYRVVVLPDEVTVAGKLEGALSRHLDSGGAILSSAWAGMKPDRSDFALAAYQLRCEGPEPHDPGFFAAGPRVAEGLPDMLTAIYDPGIAMAAEGETEVLAALHRPYFNHGEWDLSHEYLYVPPEADSGRPAVAQCGRIVHLSFPVFRGYINHAAVPYRTLLGNCLARLLPDPMVRVDNMPSFGQVTVTETGQRRLVHLLAYVPELRGKAQMVEEPISIRDVTVSLRTDGAVPRKAYLAPSRTELDLQVDGHYAKVRVPEVCGYQLVVFEQG